MSLTECPRCGYDPPPIVDDPKRSPEEEQLALQVELKCIEDSIARLTHAKSAVLRKLNNVRPAMRNLPPEVLSTIFQIARKPIDLDVQHLNLESRNTAFHAQERFLYVLAAVSHGWRQVALSTPRLWTSVRLNVDHSSPVSVERSISLLSLHIQRSRNILMSIELVFEDLPDYEEISPGHGASPSEVEEMFQDAINLRDDGIESLEPLRTALFVDRVSTIQDLVLIRPPAEWFPFMKKNLSQCRSVTIFQPQASFPEDDDELDVTDLPYLQRLQLIDWHWPRPLGISTPASISTLYLRQLPLKTCIQLLLSCRNIVKFEIVDFTDSPVWTGEEAGANEPVALPYLEHLSWSNGSRSSDGMPGLRVLCRIQLPSLRSLVWSNDPGGYAYYSIGQDFRRIFFSRLPQSLSSLTFIRMFTLAGSCFVESLLNSVPQVSELHFVDCPMATLKSAVNAIGRPILATGSVSDASTTIVLPNLIQMSINPGGPSISLSLFNFVPMFEALHKIGERRKRFQLIITENAIWEENVGVLGKLRALVEDGFDLTVVSPRQVLDLAPRPDL